MRDHRSSALLITPAANSPDATLSISRAPLVFFKLCPNGARMNYVHEPKTARPNDPLGVASETSTPVSIRFLKKPRHFHNFHIFPFEKTGSHWFLFPTRDHHFRPVFPTFSQLFTYSRKVSCSAWRRSSISVPKTVEPPVQRRILLGIMKRLYTALFLSAILPVFALGAETRLVERIQAEPGKVVIPYTK